MSCRVSLRTKRRADGGQHVAERVVAGQHLHRRPRAAVRRAQHQDARAVHLHHPVSTSPGSSSCIVRATMPPIECASMPHRLAGCLARVERRVDGVGEPRGLLLDRTPPVEGERDDLVVARTGTPRGRRRTGRSARPARRRRSCRIVGEPVEAVDQPPAEPDAILADLQVAAEDAGQHEHAPAVGGRLGRLAATSAARTPVADVPPHDSGPITRNPSGVSASSAIDDRAGRAARC